MQSELAIAIVPAGPSDAAELARVHVQAWRETYPGILPRGYLERMSAPLHARRWRARLMRMNEITLAAEGPDGLVGYASGQWSRRGGEYEGEVTTLYVLKAAQGSGLGRALLVGVARALADEGARSLVVWVLRENSRARAFYERLGGVAQETRAEQVAGGAVPAVAYRWPDIGTLARR
ncbi:GNAT family N-acetyltransferase [Phenylobacterium montanum]|uniref:GNAT family N-acetyltransferase n=1 Tax=Phenylobacterium montanum TaxID=2823693 RepID=A0A975FX61_9CAUL|nr:GNAT family N-acetyltransferase [Caulobacter sp. S6]QUD86453.1 GNAT family N-acetyltransferase [Caulobacter sp. S6]